MLLSMQLILRQINTGFGSDFKIRKQIQDFFEKKSFTYSTNMYQLSAVHYNFVLVFKIVH